MIREDLPILPMTFIGKRSKDPRSVIFVKILRSVRIKRSEQIFNNLLFKIEKKFNKKKQPLVVKDAEENLPILEELLSLVIYNILNLTPKCMISKEKSYIKSIFI